MNVQLIVRDLDRMVAKGHMIEAIEKFFAKEATTLDYRGVQTINKEQALEKIQAIMDAITDVNNITHHATLIDGNETASEFTFDFSLNGSNTIYWHEIIRRTWNEKGQVIKEEYFNSQQIVK